MDLLIDAGNTNIVFAVHNGEKIINKWRLATIIGRTADEYELAVSYFLKDIPAAEKQISRVVIGGVVPHILPKLTRFCQKMFHLEPLIAGQNSAWGFKLAVCSPERVGIDRLLNCLAVKELYPGKIPAVVVDLGTATTFDVLNAAGDFEGGVIAPGINLTARALSQAAASLPDISPEKPEKIIGKDTVCAMQSGIFFGYAGLLQGLIGRIEQEMQTGLNKIITGGSAPLFADIWEEKTVIDPDLTLKGLYFFAQRQS